MITAKRERSTVIDYTRALLVLWIVGFWHYQGYCESYIWDSQISYNITYSVLGCFFFLSGYLASCSDWKIFYVKKIIRIYPLLILSCLTLWLCEPLYGVKYFADMWHFLESVSGIAPIVNRSPSTIWFIDLLLLYFAITPFLFRGETVWNQIIKSSLACVIVGILAVVGVCDERMLIYLPAYVLGHICNVEYNRINQYKLIFSSIGTVAMIAMWVIGRNGIIEIMACSLLGAIGLNFIGIIISKLVIDNVVYQIVYASMCAYLFHRQIYHTIQHYIGFFDKSIICWSIIIITCFLLSYLIQIVYDRSVVVLVREK